MVENFEPSKAKELLDQHKEERKKYLAERKAKRDAGKDSENYYPAGGLPSDSVLVVRTEALREFEESINEVGKKRGNSHRTYWLDRALVRGSSHNVAVTPPTPWIE